MQSSTLVQRSFPACTVTVYVVGSGTPATIYSSSSGSPHLNPFTAGPDGSYLFYADDNNYEIHFSGANIITAFIRYGTVSSGSGSLANVSTTPTANFIPQAYNTALIDIGWLPRTGTGSKVLTATGTLTPDTGACFDSNNNAVSCPNGLFDATVLYVSATGNDANPGTSWAFPKRTVAAAVNALPLSVGGVASHTGTVNIGPGTFVETATPIEFNADIHLVCAASGDNGEGVNNATVIQLGSGRNTSLFSYTSAYSMANGYAHFLQADHCMFDGNKGSNSSAPALIKIWNGGYQNSFHEVGFQNAHGVALQIDNQAVNFSCFVCTFAGNDGGAFYLNDLVGANVVSFYDTQIDNSGVNPILITQALTDTGGSNIATFINTKFEATTGVVNHAHVIDFTPPSSSGNPFSINIMGLTAENTIGSGTFAIFQENQGGYGANWNIQGVNVGGYTGAFKNNKNGAISNNGEIKHLIDSDTANLYESSPDIQVSGGAGIYSGLGTPVGNVAACIGSVYMRLNGGVSTTLYVKQSGICTDNTGWAPAGGGGGGSVDATIIQEATLVAVASGSGTAYAGNATTCISSYLAGQVFLWKPDTTNTSTTPSLNICTQGPKTIVHRSDSSALANNELDTGQYCTSLYDGTNMLTSGCFMGPGTTTYTYNNSLATPASGHGNLGFYGTGKVIQGVSDDGTNSYSVQDNTCTGQVVQKIVAGSITCGSVGLEIATGSKALATGAISSGTCTSAQTATATGTLTTDTILAAFNADPTGTTGYLPSTSGGLYIIAYPTADTVNFKVCNNTIGSITPGAAITINWRTIR
jgi:hypothetical protein